MFVCKVAWWKLLSDTENAGRNPGVWREFPCADSDMNLSSLECYTWSYWGYEIWKQDWIWSELLKFLTARVEDTKRKSCGCKHIVYSSLSYNVLSEEKLERNSLKNKPSNIIQEQGQQNSCPSKLTKQINSWLISYRESAMIKTCCCWKYLKFRREYWVL